LRSVAIVSLLSWCPGVVWGGGVFLGERLLPASSIRRTFPIPPCGAFVQSPEVFLLPTYRIRLETSLARRYLNIVRQCFDRPPLLQDCCTSILGAAEGRCFCENFFSRRGRVRETLTCGKGYFSNPAPRARFSPKQLPPLSRKHSIPTHSDQYRNHPIIVRFEKPLTYEASFPTTCTITEFRGLRASR